MKELEKKFKELMKREGLEKLTKPLEYIVKIPHPRKDDPIIEKFKTAKDREEWYKIQGKAIEGAINLPLEFEERPKEED